MIKLFLREVYFLINKVEDCDLTTSNVYMPLSVKKLDIVPKMV